MLRPRLGKTWSVPDFRAEMKGPARGRGLGARLSGRRLAGRLLHPRGRDRGEPAGQKRPSIPTRCRESHCCCRGGGGPRRLALNLALCAPKSTLSVGVVFDPDQGRRNANPDVFAEAGRALAPISWLDVKKCADGFLRRWETAPQGDSV